MLDIYHCVSHGLLDTIGVCYGLLDTIGVSYCSLPSRFVKSDNYCCLGRVPYGICWYSTRYVPHGTITHVGTVHQSQNITKSERYKNRDGT